MKVFITGGAGFLGQAIMRYAQDHDLGWEITVFSRDEAKHTIVKSLFPQHHYVLGDVRDYDSVTFAMKGHSMVIHAGAMKYVPEAENNVLEAVAVNVDGSRNVARAAAYAGVDKVVGISTDKAVQPTNTYGITKMLMERMFLEADRWGDTRFNLVRYGNVIGSTGSVIPLFQQMARDKGIVTITDPNMTRFWLTVKSAVELILTALEEPEGGTTLIPFLPSADMQTTAEAAIAAAHLPTPEFKIIGTRPGEKMHESLLSAEETSFAEWALDLVRDDLIRLYPRTSKPRLMTQRASGASLLAYNSDGHEGMHVNHLTADALAQWIAE